VISQLAWLVGFALLLVALVRATAAARLRPRDPVGRVRVLATALAVGGLGVGAVWVWSGAQAREGRDRIEAGGPQVDAPARARLFLRAVQLLVPRDRAEVATVGYSPSASMRLPRRYGLDESQRGWDLLEIGGFGARGLRVGVRAQPEATSTRVVVVARPQPSASSTGELAQLARTLVTRGGRCRAAATADASQVELGESATGAVIALLCRDGGAVAALAFERDLGPRDSTDPQVAVRVTPLTWSRRGFDSDHEQLAAGTLLQIGALTDAVPGITLWEVPAPRGRAELFFPPPDVLARCDEWVKRRGPILPAAVERPRLPVDRATVLEETGSTCVLPFVPPYALEVRRLVPDVGGLDARATWAAALLIAPALLGLLLLAGGTAAGLTRARLARALTLSWLGVLMAALGVWRLLWAHRLDMMRDYDAVGERVIQNAVLLALVAATLAAWSALAMFDGHRRRRVGAALVAALTWGAALAVGGLALRGERAVVLDSRGLYPQLVLSLGLGLLPALSSSFLVGLGARLDGFARARGLFAEGDERAARLVAAALAIAALAIVGKLRAPGAVALKLPLAWLVILVGYAALREAVTAGRGRRGWRIAAVFATLVAAVAMLGYDAGVTAALVGPGLPIALVFASHDAVFDDRKLGRLRSFELRHAPLVRRHAIVIGAVAVGIVAWTLLGGGADLAPAMTGGALRAPLVLAVLLIVVAQQRWQHGRDPRGLAPWLALAAILVGVWAAKAPLIDRLTDSDSRHASRLSIVVDPGYALLRDERDFLSGLTAWRETILPADTGTVATGQGYFGAQVVDPGVRSAIEGDYAPVLFLRETGALGLGAVAVLLLLTCAGLWLVAGERFVHGGPAQRSRALAATVLGALCVYQPLASLGVLPLTGICWPGLGLNSPSDFWLLLGLCGWVVMLGPGAADALTAPVREADDPRSHDAELRGKPVFKRTRRVAAMVAAVVAIAGLAVVARASVFALRRPSPVDEAGQVSPGFAGLGRAIDYADKLQCPRPMTLSDRAEALVPDALLGEPLDDTTRRFHDQLAARWHTARDVAVDEVDGFLHDPTGAACRKDRGGWSFARIDDDDGRGCRARYSWGWPEVQLEIRAPDHAVRRADDDVRKSDDAVRKSDDKSAVASPAAAPPAAGPQAVATCAIELPGDALRELRRPARRPYRGTRVRLVAKPMGAAALDRGELVAGHITVRLRPGAGFVDVSHAQAGVFAAESVQLSDELKVELTHDGLRASGVAWTFVKNPPRTRVQVLEADPTGWRLVEPPVAGTPADAIELPLTSMSVLVVGARDGRNLWLFRPPRAWPGDPTDTVDMLLADDVRTGGASGRIARRRHYVFGGDLPELGWSTSDPSMSLGLDGWVQAALGEIERGAGRDRAQWREGSDLHATCGTLAPLAPSTAGLDERVCTRSPFDGVLECRIAMQPELAIALRHLTELVAVDPKRWTGLADSAPATEAQYVLVRGDTGELVAQGEFVPGRASLAYAPATPEIEQHLIRLLEDRDVHTGAKLPGGAREDSAEKIEWSSPIAVGSTLKPVMARAAELAASAITSRLVLTFAPAVGCGTRKQAAMLGHCPPTPLGARSERFDLHDFLAQSSNWYMAALGILGTAMPDGEVRVDGAPRPLDEIVARNTGAWQEAHAITTNDAQGRVVIGANRVDLAVLRETPLWRSFERLLGREMCTLGDKRLCERRGARRDLCAARALPIAAPTTRQRHLVALGSDRFDLYGSGARLGDIPVRDYFQFLRGSGLHPVASLAQLADTFGRIVYDQPDASGRFDLAASWFPVAATGVVPSWDCRTGEHDGTVTGAGGGLCGSLRNGTSRVALQKLFADDRIVFYGAKTGTIDSLGDIVEDRQRCERWNRAHTVAGKRSAQPYRLDCERAIDDDSLLLVAFGIRTPTGVVPFTLGLRFERAGKGTASLAARHYLTAIAAYFTASWSVSSPAPAASGSALAWPRSPSSSSSPSPASPSAPSTPF